MYGGMNATLREEERRKKLIEAGLEAFGTKGYAKTSIKTICALAGLTERYFYESFLNKEDLLRAVYRELIEEEKSAALEALQDPQIIPGEAASHAIRMFYERFQQDPRKAQTQLFEVLGVSLSIDHEYQNAMRILADMVKIFLCRAFPGIRPEALSSIIPTGLAGSIILICQEWVLDGFVTPLDEIIAQMMDIFFAVGKHLEARQTG